MNIKELGSGFYKLIDRKQPEVRLAFFLTIVFGAFLVIISFHSDFLLYEDAIFSLMQSLIAGTIGMIGVAISGVAIVIALFKTEQINAIETAYPGAYKSLLDDFKWLAIIATIDVAAFASVSLIVRSPYPVAPFFAFYTIVFILGYGLFYLLFYCYALIGNCIKLSKLRCALDTVLFDEKTSGVEFQLDFLVSRLFQSDRAKAQIYYNDLIKTAEQSTLPNKDKILQHLKERYKNL